MRTFMRMLQCSAGVSAAEYALILAIVGSAIAVAAMSVGSSIATSMNNMTDRIGDCADGSC